MDTILDILLPSSDRVVLYQVIGAAALSGASLAWAWRKPDWRIFLVGFWMLVFAWFGLRTLH